MHFAWSFIEHEFCWKWFNRCTQKICTRHKINLIKICNNASISFRYDICLTTTTYNEKVISVPSFALSTADIYLWYLYCWLANIIFHSCSLFRKAKSKETGLGPGLWFAPQLKILVTSYVKGKCGSCLYQRFTYDRKHSKGEISSAALRKKKKKTTANTTRYEKWIAFLTSL